MTLGELKADLRILGIKQVGTLRIRALPKENGSEDITIYFSSDDKILVPFAPKTLYPLVMKSDADDTHVNIEKVNALKRYFIPDWDEKNKST
jgi:hypothetical protein